ncbi:MAG TPA: outer membrane beta-barrel protein [Polyangia bacterium]|jgi:hypothetical protein|nr:outer membrane beta-barrel protein [Polyangia bacterium]
MTIRRPLQILACCAALGVSRGGFAQQAGDVSLSYTNLPARSPLGKGTGMQLSDSAVLHAGVGVEGGYDTNVFYGDKGNAVVGSPVVLVLPYLGLTNATRAGVAPSGVFYNLEATAGYRHYLSNAEQPDQTGAAMGKKVSDQPGFLPTADGQLVFSSRQVLSLVFRDYFVRAQDPPYVGSPAPSESLIHYSNFGAAELHWAPGGGRLDGILRYSNIYDAFNAASSYNFADSLFQELAVDVSWKWLPKTALFVQAAQGYITYLNPNASAPTAGTGASPSDFVKHDSYPMRVVAGLRGLVTQKTSVNLYAGYANAFYADGPNPEGIAGHLSANAEVSVTPTFFSSLGLGYHHDFQNSIVGNFYNIDAVTAWIQQQIAGRVVASLSGRYERRAFQFTASSRTDNFLQVGALADYHPKGWLYFGVGYSLLDNQAGSNPNGPVGASYLKQQIFARVGVIY